MAWQCFFVLFSLFHLLFRINWVTFPYKVLPRGNCRHWVLPCSCTGCGSLSSIRYYTSPNASTLLPICPYCFYYPLDLTPCWLAGVTCLLSVFCCLTPLYAVRQKHQIIINTVTAYSWQIDANTWQIDNGFVTIYCHFTP